MHHAIKRYICIKKAVKHQQKINMTIASTRGLQTFLHPNLAIDLGHLGDAITKNSRELSSVK